VGYGANVGSGNLVDATVIGWLATVDASPVRIGGMQITQIGGQVGWSNLSDLRSKTNVVPLDLGLDFVMALRPVSFTMKQGNGRTDMEFIAQDVERPLGHDHNVLGIGGDSARTLSLRYTDFIAPMVKAMQEQEAKIESQEATIAAKRPNWTTRRQTSPRSRLNCRHWSRRKDLLACINVNIFESCGAPGDPGRRAREP
jgi:hypothetical protein